MPLKHLVEAIRTIMNDKRPENIVAMTDYKAPVGNMNTLSLEILNECRDLMADRLSQSVNVVLNTADDLLFDLLQKSGSTEHHFYFNAMREVRLKRTAIETGFKDSFINLFNKSIKPVRDDGRISTGDENTQEIDIEESIALSATVGKIRHDCHQALYMLDQRMSELLASIKSEKRQNPVRPEMVCTAFQEACQQIDSGIEIKLILFKLFEKNVLTGLHSAYLDMDKLLTEKKTGSANSGYVSVEKEVITSSQTERNAGIIKDKNYFINANRTIRNEIRSHLGKSVLPEFITDFLYYHWSKLLLKIHIKEGTDSKAWLHAMDVVDDLVNLLGSETSDRERLNLEGLMPNLLQRLKFGMNVIPVTPAVREEFLSQLKSFHKCLLDKADPGKTIEEKVLSEDITIPSFRSNSIKTPFSDELLIDNKRNTKPDFDIE